MTNKCNVAHPKLNAGTKNSCGKTNEIQVNY